MTTDELEVLLEGAEETSELEFKAAIPWDVRTFVKDVLAMANLVDGGTIIVGVENDTFQRQGCTEDQVATYNIDIMKDQVSAFADPMAQFRKEIVSDRNGLRYVVIQVSSFDEMPVICSRTQWDVHAGVIYYRSRARRPESARVSRSVEMREIIETSIARRLANLRRVGLVNEPDQRGYDYDRELGDLE